MEKKHCKPAFERADPARRETVLQTGINEFSQHGFENANITVIAKNAGISIGLMYKYFETKEDLFILCLEQAIEELNRVIESVLQSDDKILVRAEKAMGRSLPLDPEARATLRDLADGDGRYIINLIESVFNLTKEGETLDRERLLALVQQKAPGYDKDGDGHYNLISALHKSLRGSDTDAALYWAARMIEGGEDPLYLLRRLTRFAMEDVSMADPNALNIAIAAWDTYERLGSPEGDLAIAELVVYLGTAPKSNSIYRAWMSALKAAKKYGTLTPPAHILNAPTKLMKELGYGKGYQYDQDLPDAFSGQNYFPDKMPRQKFYDPPERGFEREIVRRLAYWERLRREKNGKS